MLYVLKLNGTGSTLKMHVIETNPQMFGYHNITIAAYDFQNQNPLLDSVAVPFLIKVNNLLLVFGWKMNYKNI